MAAMDQVNAGIERLNESLLTVGQLQSQLEQAQQQAEQKRSALEGLLQESPAARKHLRQKFILLGSENTLEISEALTVEVVPYAVLGRMDLHDLEDNERRAEEEAE